MAKIISIKGYEVLDSRGIPTVEVEVITENNVCACAMVPSGASTGEKEAIELRDNDKNYFHGKGVLKAINNINKIIAPKIINNFSVFEQEAIDNFMIELDGSKTKMNLGANAILAVSMAVCKAAAKELKVPLYQYIGGVNKSILPVPMLNIINGGAHALNCIDFQEFMIVPIGFSDFKEAMRCACEVYYCLKDLLKKNNFSTNVGDEGGFAPNIEKIETVLDYLVEAIKTAGYYPSKTGKNAVAIALDVAASELYNKDDQKYYFKKLGNFLNKDISFTTDELIKYYETLIKNYPIISIEDPLDENDWNGFAKITKEIGKKVQIVGDDLFVTNIEYLEKGIINHSANAILIKLNQIGTVTETLKVIDLAKSNKWATIISHRSGETEDTFIADLAVGTSAKQIKTGSCARSDRVAKYNRLLKIYYQNQEKKYLGICGCSFNNISLKD
ncbi:phosphopyruvate hydratase [symbiont of Argiope bruennichi]|uniref:phosphopyruvate hydratase n=1 Tax=symbiont of Argiope bruennichi TaxID=2810479 RepID=UPI003DA2C4C0